MDLPTVPETAYSVILTDSPFTNQGGLWDKERPLLGLSEIYQPYYGWPSPDMRSLADFVEERETAPREPGCYFYVWDWTRGPPSETPWCMGNWVGAEKSRWVLVGPVEGPHTRKMASADPSPAQRDAEARLCADAATLTRAAADAFLADYCPTKATIDAVLEALPADADARPLFEALLVELGYVKEEVELVFCPSPAYAPSSPPPSPKRKREPEEAEGPALKRHKSLSPEQ